MHVSFHARLCYLANNAAHDVTLQPALDAGEAAEGRQLLAQAGAAAAGAAAPRVHLSFQLVGYSSNASLAEAIKGSLMPTAVKVLQKMFQVLRER
jgi:hypothetical protein